LHKPEVECTETTVQEEVSSAEVMQQVTGTAKNDSVIVQDSSVEAADEVEDESTGLDDEVQMSEGPEGPAVEEFI